MKSRTNNFIVHERRDKVKWIIAFLLIAVLLIGMVGSWAILLKDRSEDQNKETDNPSSVTDGSGNAMVSGELYAMPSNMIFSATSAEQSETDEGIRLLATVYPETATNKALDWNVGFIDPTSAWANGKSVSDYVSVTPDSDGAQIVTVKCFKAFGERIRITAVSRANPYAKAECVLDYARRILDSAIYSEKLDRNILEFGENEVVMDMVSNDYNSFVAGVQSGTIWAGNCYNIYLGDVSLTPEEEADPEAKWADVWLDRTYRFSDYTIKDCMVVAPTVGSEYATKHDFQMEIADGFLELVKELYDKIAAKSNRLPSTVDIREQYYMGNNPVAMALKMYGSLEIWASEDMDEEIYTEMLGKMIQWIQANPDTPILTYTVSDKGKYSAYSKTMTFRFQPDTVQMPVFSVSVDQGAIVM